MCEVDAFNQSDHCAQITETVLLKLPAGFRALLKGTTVTTGGSVMLPGLRFNPPHPLNPIESSQKNVYLQIYVTYLNTKHKLFQTWSGWYMLTEIVKQVKKQGSFCFEYTS